MNYVPSKFPVAREAWPFAVPAGLLTAAASAWWWITGVSAPLALAIVAGLLFVYILAFFRNPERSGPADTDAVYAPADGLVVSAGLVPHADFEGGQALRIAIFMNLFNVHICWAPLSGRVTAAKHHAGRFLNAMVDKCAEENERKVLGMDFAGGARAEVKLVAGLVARRIVCPVEAGDTVARGEKMGLIRFGSRVEVLLPADSRLETRVGQKVRGGQTVVASHPGAAPANAAAASVGPSIP